ncbi:hypothetical protein D3C87_1996400 [compost metagenome]
MKRTIFGLYDGLAGVLCMGGLADSGVVLHKAAALNSVRTIFVDIDSSFKGK